MNQAALSIRELSCEEEISGGNRNNEQVVDMYHMHGDTFTTGPSQR